LKGYVASNAFAGPYLADQLVLPFTLAGGGSFTTVKPSGHLLTGIDIARRFTGTSIVLGMTDSGHHGLTFG